MFYFEFIFPIVLLKPWEIFSSIVFPESNINLELDFVLIDPPLKNIYVGNAISGFFL